MSTVATRTATTAPRVTALRPSFMGAIRGEMLKVSRQLATWLMLLAGIGLFVFVSLAVVSTDNFKSELHATPVKFFYDFLDIMATLFNVGSGIFLLIVSSRLVGMEYSSGTIRVLLGRGVGRLQLYFAKVVALVMIAFGLLAGFVLCAGVLLYLMVQGWSGSMGPVASLPAEAWRNAGMAGISALVSLAVVILVGTTAAVVGRSLAFGVAAAMSLFPADNFGTVVMLLVNRVAHNDFWLNVPSYLLGPNLNVLASKLESTRVPPLRAAFASPPVAVDTNHVLAVIGAYSLGFLLLAVVLSWRRDVLE